MEDMQEYGFDFRGMKCDGKMCFTGGKSYEDFVKSGTAMSTKQALKKIDEYA